MGGEAGRDLGPKFSEGARLLWLRSRNLGHSPETIRQVIGCTNGVVNRWLYGERGIELALAVRVEDAYGIPVRAWLMKPTKPFRLPCSERSKAA